MTRWAVLLRRCWVVIGLARQIRYAVPHQRRRPLQVTWMRCPAPTSVHWSRIAAVVRGKLGDSSLPPRMLN